ncbi:MAG: glycosyl hydrolase family 28-related protein [Solirubrobacterales bacterium]
MGTDLTALAIAAITARCYQVSVKAFGAKGDGVTDDTAAIRSALNSITGKAVLVFPPGNYLVTGTIPVKGDVIYDFCGSTVHFTGSGSCFSCVFPEGNPQSAFFRDLTLTMTEGSQNQIGFDLFAFGGGLFENIQIQGGAYGIKSVHSWMWTVNNLRITNASYAGIYHQGDHGSEFNWNDIYISIQAFSGKYGIEIERTTPADVGGYYWNKVLVVVNSNHGGSLEQGIHIHSSASERTPIILAMLDGGADGLGPEAAAVGHFGLNLVNVSAIRVTNSWVSTIRLSNTDTTIFSGSYVPYGFWFKGTGIVSRAFMAANVNCGEGRAFFFDDGAAVENFFYQSVYCHPAMSLSTHMEKITAGYDPQVNKIYTDPTVGSGALCIENAADAAKKKYFRLDAYGSLVTLNADFTAAIAELRDSGILNLPVNTSALLIGGTQVVKSRIGGWTTPTGASRRTGYNTAAATAAQVAETLRALIEDLKAHGLIGD